MAESLWNYKDEEIVPEYANFRDAADEASSGGSDDSDEGPAAHLDRIYDPNREDAEDFEMRRFFRTFNPKDFFCDRCGSTFNMKDIAGGKFICPCGGQKSASSDEPLQSTLLVWERKGPPWWDLTWEETKRAEGILDAGEEEAVAEHPEIDEECPQCGNERLQFWTRQLRSADEGLSVFYLCKKCGWRTVDK
eukprot:CAMPEP_0175232786 /NCGR_PEP_ID=MMETSP0093-20121207/26139_1 /TAXON_ID=311494 /ORGANISM="Alexandrium monilatum, Strain CCMP3105" /LENGTH=191 /DNA_ID=CAMNT_0016526655 /DNA_START=22 /DNA_END=597 /DNA_ORIENTATION=+